jgi:protein-S-isoprenylcysteine O-methyltransferase Ste14
MNNPKAKMWFGSVATFVLIGLVLFLSAGTIDYWQAWVYLVVCAIASVPTILAITQDPILLESRTKGGPAAEQRPIEKIIVLCLGLAAIATFIVPGLDRRFGWSSVPPWLSIAGDLLVIASLWLVYRVFKENSFGATTVEVAEGQHVITTGPYAIVRNPMYSSAAVFFVGTSLALGSYWGLVPALLTILGFAWRLVDEEEMLAQSLPGYREYCAKVRWHLIPGVF